MRIVEVNRCGRLVISGMLYAFSVNGMKPGGFVLTLMHLFLAMQLKTGAH